MIDVSGLVQWMGENDKLAGWAQAIGAGLALVVAIGVPWWQHRREQRARKMEALQLDYYLAINLYYLVLDVQVLCRRIIRMREFGDNTLKQRAGSLTLSFQDLMERMRSHESRDHDVERRIILTRVRSHVTFAHSTYQGMGNESTKAEDLEAMAKGSKSSDRVLRDAAALVDSAYYQIDLAKTFVAFRPIIWLVHQTTFGRVRFPKKAHPWA